MEDFSGASHDVVIIAFFRGCKIDLINRGTVFHALVNPKGKDVLFADPRVGKYGGFCFLFAELRVSGAGEAAASAMAVPPPITKPQRQPQWQSPSRLISLKTQVSYFTPSFSFGLSFCLDCVYSISHKDERKIKMKKFFITSRDLDSIRRRRSLHTT